MFNVYHIDGTKTIMCVHKFHSLILMKDDREGDVIQIFFLYKYVQGYIYVKRRI